MAWKYGHKTIKLGRSWTDNNGIQHPANWSIWSDEQKASIGLVWEDDPQPYDNRFWWDANTPKAIEDINEVDSEGNPILDEKGNQLVTKGLKSQWKELTKKRAGDLLAPTDWMIVKAAEVDSYTVSSDILQFRANVRTASNNIEAAIDAAVDHDAFLALHEYTEDEEGNQVVAPINDWPESL